MRFKVWSNINVRLFGELKLLTVTSSMLALNKQTDLSTHGCRWFLLLCNLVKAIDTKAEEAKAAKAAKASEPVAVTPMRPIGALFRSFQLAL